MCREDNFALKNKKILIISPQPWGEMFVSKHHYAIELAKINNQVYFLNPNDSCLKEWVKIEKHKSIDNLFIVSHRFFFPFIIRFHLLWLYRILADIQFRLLLRKLKVKLDILWCFDAFAVPNLKVFGAAINIFHPVDISQERKRLRPDLTADFILSTSRSIIEQYQGCKSPAFVINHGVSEEFIHYSRAILKNETFKVSHEKIKVGYLGNLFIQGLYLETIKKIIIENPLIEFIFWGSYKFEDCNLGGLDTDENRIFIDFLKSQHNVILRGVCEKTIIAKEMQDVDIFLSCHAGSDNPHKILEYLSTGKVIVANYISAYTDKEELLLMAEEGKADLLPVLFKKAVNNLDKYNNCQVQKKRIEFALCNSYLKHIKTIENIIQDSLNYRKRVTF